MAYQPNINDPRVRSRIARALGFACGVMSTTKSHPWSSRHIDKYFGNQRNDLSRYLRKQLLICTDEFYRYNSTENKCKEYRLNELGVKSLREMMKITNIQIYPSVVEVAKSDHLAELTTGKFEYSDKSNRLWHPLQRYRKQHKQQILTDHGYLHHYDIECAAPTIIHQYSQMIPEVIVDGKWQQGPMDLYLFALRRYLRDRTQVRDQLAEALELPIDAIKEVINALFAGASVSLNKKTDIYHILNGDSARIEYLKQDEFICELRADIKTTWEYIRPVMQKRTKLQSNGKERRCPLTGKQKWGVYFEQERRVLDSVKRYLDDKTFRYFLEHDGFACERPIDRDELSNYVLETTGFNLKFEYKRTNIQIYPSVVEVEIKEKSHAI